MKIDEQIKQKLEEAIDILKKFGMPSAQQNERTAYCLLSLLNVTPEKDKKTFTHYAQEIAWETEAWIADNPTHMIHFNGDKFIGPHKK